MADLPVRLRGLYEAYKTWVSDNPQFVSDVETTAKWVSYFIAGRISNSSIVSELIYSLSNILVLFNDRIIAKANAVSMDEGIGYRLKVCLTTLEYCEVFIEISAKKLYGERGRWFFITVVQILKSIGRFLLMNNFSADIITVPIIPVLDRKKLQEKAANMQPGTSDFNENHFYFKLKRSGRVVRKIEGAPPLQYRNFKPLRDELNDARSHALVLKTAESLYIAKPLIHLLSIYLFGYKSWKSYGTSFIVDFMSIRLYYNNRDMLTQQQKIELSRRCVNLLLYLVRSPMYEKTSERRLTGFLNAMANNIPFAKTICHPLIEYIPIWQDTYFYMWSTVAVVYECIQGLRGIKPIFYKKLTFSFMFCAIFNISHFYGLVENVI